MKIHKKKRIAARVLGVGRNKITFDPEKLDEVSGALTRKDINSLIKKGIVSVKKTSSQSRSRKRKDILKKRKGRIQKTGSRKGTKKARNPPKKEWMRKIRLQRAYLLTLKMKNLLTVADYRNLRAKSKGGFFRSLRHLKLYIQERGMLRKEHGN